MGAEVEFDGVPHVFDEGVHFGVEGGGLFVFDVGAVFGAGLFGFGGVELVDDGGDFGGGGPGEGAFADLGGVVCGEAGGFAGDDVAGPEADVGRGDDVGEGVFVGRELVVAADDGGEVAGFDGALDVLDGFGDE